jgi:CTP synthase (UTP-ammonia lyase)
MADITRRYRNDEPTQLPVRLAIVGEHDPAFPPHRAVAANVEQVASTRGIDIRAEWVPTLDVEREGAARLAAYDAIWISPGSPYRSLAGALSAIRFAREAGVPLLGTCAGFQHIVLEYGRNVMGLDAYHAESDPDGPILLLTPLACSVAGMTMPVTLDGASRVAGWYGTTRITEHYYCNYGLNPDFEEAFETAGLSIVGWDDGGEPRVVDIPGHPFYVGVLYVPEPAREPGLAHPLVAAFIEAARLVPR